MTFLSQNLEGLFVPIGTRNPRFNFTTGFGPSFARESFIECLNRNEYEIRAVLPHADLILNEPFDYTEPDMREIIYLAFNGPQRWIFVYDITEDLGILFSDDPPTKLVPDTDAISADLQFNQVCEKWVKFDNPTHADAIRKWVNIRRS